MTEKFPISPVVAQASPNLYAASVKANLNPEAAAQVEQLGATMVAHKKLSKLDTEQAYKQFSSLSEEAQSSLKYFFKDAPYMHGKDSLGTNIAQAGKWIATHNPIASPLIFLYKALTVYTKAINTPYLVARQVSQGADIFSKKVWEQGFDGRNLYDKDGLKKAVDAFGEANVNVAKGLLKGDTLGKIVINYGNDPVILNAVSSAATEPDKWKQIMDLVKFAQISPGRDLARNVLDTVPPANGGLHGDYVSSGQKNLSGWMDAIYQIAIDPLTWITGGSNKAGNLGEKLAKSVLDKTNADIPAPIAVADAFKNKKIYTLWQDQIGPKIERYANGNKAEKQKVYEEIRREHPDMANIAQIEIFANAGIKDAETAQNFFGQIENLPSFLGGSVDGMTYYRNGIAVARRKRLIADGLGYYMDSIFNAADSRTFGPLKTAGRDAVTLEKDGPDAVAALFRSGETVDGWMRPNQDQAAIEKFTKEISKMKKLGQLASRHSGGRGIFIDDEHVTLTVPSLVAKLRMIYNRDIAEFVAQDFVHNKTPDERVVVVRNLYSAIMDSMGIAGHSAYREMKEKILSDKFANKGGFATMKDTNINPEWVDSFPESAIKHDGDALILQSQDPINPNQSTYMIGDLDYKTIYRVVNDVKSKASLISSLRGPFTSKLTQNYMDVWSTLTLLPRLGIRSSIDEVLMFYLTAPLEDLWKYATGKGHALGNILDENSGSMNSTGPIRMAIDASLLKLGINTSIYKRLSLEQRQAILNGAKDKDGNPIDPSLLSTFQKRSMIADNLKSLYSSRIDPEESKFMKQALIHSPGYMDGTIRSLVADSALSGRLGKDVQASIITPSSLDMGAKSLGLVDTGHWGSLSTKELTDFSELHIAFAHFSQWFPKVVANKTTLYGDKGARLVDPFYVFMKNHGLKSGKTDTGITWFEQAKRDYMESIGVRFDAATGGYTVVDKKAVKEFLGMSARTVALRARNKTDAQIVEDQAVRVLADMQTTFHGSATGYNQLLMDALTDIRKHLRETIKSEYEPTWSQAAAGMTLDNFVKLTTNHRPIGEINSSFDLLGLEDMPSAWAKYGDKFMEYMDRQISGIYRQPAVTLVYVRLRKAYTGMEQQMASNHLNAMVKQAQIEQNIDVPNIGKRISPSYMQWIETHAKDFDHKKALIAQAKERLRNEPWHGLNPKYYDILVGRANKLAEAHFTTVAMENAGHAVMKFADNPSIRSNFAYANRTVGRYYRATEDFQRRIYRLKSVPLRVLYRTRLLSLGINASGDVHEDEQGNPYVVMPMDNILFKATDTTIRTLTGNTGYEQPAFNNFTLKLKMMNPSFQDDAGTSILSGPVASLSALAMKAILGSTERIPFIGDKISPTAIEIGDAATTTMFGNMGESSSISEALRKAMVPQSVQRVIAMLPYNEQTRQEITAGQQAMAFNAAAGRFLDSNATDADKNAYIKNIKISAHNIQVLRNILGLVLPVSPSLQDGIDMPEYLKQVGTVGLRSEYFDILEGIMSSPVPVQDPYGQAAAVFVGKYPNRLVYTTSPSDRNIRVIVEAVGGLKSWAIGNKKFLDTYGQAGLIFAPRVGDFDNRSYAWTQAAGFVKSKKLEEYYDDILTTTDVQKYYKIADDEKAALALTTSSDLRRNIIETATRNRELLHASNPLLREALKDKDKGSRETILRSLTQIVEDPKSPLSEGTRTRMTMAVNLVNDFISFAKNPEYKHLSNFSDLKRERKQAIIKQLETYMTGDASVTEANRAVFKGILSFYSRDTNTIEWKP